MQKEKSEIVELESGWLLLNRKELAARIGVHRDTIIMWEREGMPCMRIAPRTIRFEIVKVRAWLEKRSAEAAQKRAKS